MINYSIEAYNDGFDFSNLSLEEQEMTKNLYVSYETMAELDGASIVFDKIMNNRNYIASFKEKWEFNESGTYYGYIISVNPHPRNQNEFIINLLINDTEVRHIKFKTYSYNNVVWRAINETISGGFEISDLIGSLVRVEVNNIIKNDGNPFSYIVSMEFFSNEEINTLYKMLDTMVEQSDNREE